MKKGSRGFTLIELLVVIAIIAILAAILFPVFTQARAKARQISCLSNVKNLSLAILMYVDDYDGKFPLNSRIFTNVGGYGGNPTGSEMAMRSVYWPNDMSAYIGSPDIMHCPADGGMSSTNGPLTSYFNEGEDCFLMTADEYAYAQISAETGGVFGCFGVPEAQIPEPGNTAMIGCCPMNLGNSTVAAAKDSKGVYLLRTNMVSHSSKPVCYFALLCSGTDSERQGNVIHNGGSNLGFADGHAKWLKVQKMFYPRNLFARHIDAVGWDPYGNIAGSGYATGYYPTF